jgi:hypothetical protein
MNNPMTATHVFYSSKENCIIDTCTDEIIPRGHYGKKTLEQTRLEYLDAVYMPFEDASKLMDEKNTLPVSEITKEDFWYFLEVLPPNQWIQESGCESFKMSEHWSGPITSIYARIGKRYFTLRDNYKLPHDEIMKRCKEFIGGKS